MIPILLIVHIIRFNLTCQMKKMLLPNHETHIQEITGVFEQVALNKTKIHHDRHMDTLIHIEMKVYVRLEPLNLL